MNMSFSAHLPLRRQFCQCLRQAGQAQRSLAPSVRQQQRLLSTSRTLRATAQNPLRKPKRMTEEEYAKSKRSIAISGVGIIACAAAIYGITRMEGFQQAVDEQKREGKSGSSGVKLDGPPGLETEPTTVFIDGAEQVSTGNSTVPTFPKTLKLPKNLHGGQTDRQIGDEVQIDSGSVEEYRLLGLGIRTVSFLSIQVYVVGLYIAASDIATLQQRLVRQAAIPATGAPNESAIAATSLVPGEREALKQLLLDPEKGEEAWNRLVKDGGVRTALRIVPTRNTDFMHLRDGWIRQITARAQRANAQAKELAAKREKQEGGAQGVVVPESEFADDTFGNAMNDFKTLFGGGVRKNVPKGQMLLLLRDKVGSLDILFQAGERKPLTWLGGVGDERISRLLWMGYLSGKNVASEGARKNVIDGVMEIVERPVGTV